MVTRLKFKDHVRIWKFYVIDSAPFPAILGADAILSWPIFFSPLDYRIFIIPELYHSSRNVGDLGGVYEYWHNRDGLRLVQIVWHIVHFINVMAPQLYLTKHLLHLMMRHIEQDMLLCLYVI